MACAGEPKTRNGHIVTFILRIRKLSFPQHSKSEPNPNRNAQINRTSMTRRLDSTRLDDNIVQYRGTAKQLLLQIHPERSLSNETKHARHSRIAHTRAIRRNARADQGRAGRSARRGEHVTSTDTFSAEIGFGHFIGGEGDQPAPWPFLSALGNSAARY